MVDATVKYITIPMPRMTQNLYRGLIGVRTAKTNPVSIRWTDDDRSFIERQAAHIGVTFSEFVRWCALYGSMEVQKLQMQEDFKLVMPTKPKQKVDMSGFE